MKRSKRVCERSGRVLVSGKDPGESIRGSRRTSRESPGEGPERSPGGSPGEGPGGCPQKDPRGSPGRVQKELQDVREWFQEVRERSGRGFC